MKKNLIFLLVSIVILLLGVVFSIISNYVYDLWYISGFAVGFIITIITNVVFFGLCVFGLTKMFNSEKVMFNS